MKPKDFKMAEPDWGFSSETLLGEKDKTTYMHVMAKGSDLEKELIKIFEENLDGCYKEELPNPCALSLFYQGKREIERYLVFMAHGYCPTLNGYEGYDVAVTTELNIKDELSPIVAEKMKSFGPNVFLD